MTIGTRVIEFEGGTAAKKVVKGYNPVSNHWADCLDRHAAVSG